MARSSIDPFLLILIGVGGYLFFAKKTQTTVAPRGTAPRVQPVTGLTATRKNEDVLFTQRSLNSLMGCGLVEDGILGTHTRNCILRFQQMRGITADGILGPETQYEIRSALGWPGYIEQPYGFNPSGNEY